MRYGEDVTVGDMVKVVLMSGVSSVERLTAAKVEVGSDGLKVQLVPGNPDAGNPMFKQAAIIRNLRARIRNLEQEDS